MARRIGRTLEIGRTQELRRGVRYRIYQTKHASSNGTQTMLLAGSTGMIYIFLSMHTSYYTLTRICISIILINYVRYLYTVTSTACSNETEILLYSDHEKCQSSDTDNADTVNKRATAACWIYDVENGCESQSFVWKWDIESLKSGGTEKILIGFLVFVLLGGIWTMKWLLA